MDKIIELATDLWAEMGLEVSRLDYLAFLEGYRNGYEAGRSSLLPGYGEGLRAILIDEHGKILEEVIGTEKDFTVGWIETPNGKGFICVPIPPGGLFNTQQSKVDDAMLRSVYNESIAIERKAIVRFLREVVPGMHDIHPDTAYRAALGIELGRHHETLQEASRQESTPGEEVKGDSVTSMPEVKPPGGVSG